MALIDLCFQAAKVLFKRLDSFVQRVSWISSSRSICPHGPSTCNGRTTPGDVNDRATQKALYPHTQALQKLWLPEFTALNPGQLIGNERKANDLKRPTGDG